MPKVLSYDNFKNKIGNLDTWNPDTQYISKDLSLRTKPKKTGFWRRVCCLFIKSKSGQAVTASKVIKAYTELYQKELMHDKATLEQLKHLNKKMHDRLVIDVNHHIKSKKKQNTLDVICKETDKICKSYKAKAKVLVSSTPSKKPTFHTPSTTSSVSLIFPIPNPPPATQPGPAPAPQPAPAPKPAPAKGSNKIPKPIKPAHVPSFKDAKALENFITTMNPSTIEEAAALFEGISKALDTSDLSKALTEKNANALLIASRTIKRKFVSKKSTDSKHQPLKKAYLGLCTRVRRPFFAEKINRNRENLEAIKATVKSQFGQGIMAKLAPISQDTVKHILTKWERQIDKCVPVAMPYVYHCTKEGFVHNLIGSGVIEARYNYGGYGGAYVSSVAEMGNGYSDYGPYCFALSEDVILNANLNALQGAPRITNVNSSKDGSGWEHDKVEPIYLGKKNLPKKTAHKGQPRVWIGLQENIDLNRPNKESDPMGHWGHTYCSFFAFMDPQGYGLPKSFDAEIIPLQERGISLLSKEEFEAITQIVQASLHFTLPKTWAGKAKSPNGCQNILPKGAHSIYHNQQPVTLIENIKGVTET